MTTPIPMPTEKIAAPHGGPNQTWWQYLKDLGERAASSEGSIGELGTAASKDIATEAEVRAYANAEKVITTGTVRAAAAFEPLEYAATVAIDWEAGATRDLVMAGDAVLGNPTNAIPGTFMTLYVIGESASVRELTYGSSFGGTHPATDDIDNAKAYVVTILCRSSSHFVASAIDGSPP